MQPEGKGNQWLPFSQCLGTCIWGIASSVGLPSAREEFVKKSESSRGMLKWFGCKGVSAGEETEKIGLAQVEDERTKGDLTADFSSVKGI